MLESIFASLIANMLWDEMKVDKLEKKLNTIVLSSNQALIWDTLVKIKKNNSVEGFGKLFQVN